MRLFVGYPVHKPPVYRYNTDLDGCKTVMEQFGHLSTMDLTLHNEMLHRPILPGSTM